MSTPPTGLRIVLVALFVATAVVIVSTHRRDASAPILGALTAPASAPEAILADVAVTAPIVADANPRKHVSLAPKDAKAAEDSAVENHGALPLTRQPVLAAALLAPPSPQTMREEAAANPHVTPPSILRFATAWATHMPAAESDADLAESLVTQSEAWVGERDEVVAPVIQAICLGNTRVLADTHTALSPRYEAMRRRASEQVIQLAAP